jgi:hypothetical protein
MSNLADTRRRFMAHFAGIGLGSTLVPGIVWARMQDQGTQRVTLAMVKEALRLQGIDLPDTDLQAMVAGANQNLTRYEEVRKMHIPLDVSPPFHFSALAPGIEPNRTRLPFRMSVAPSLKRPANLEEVAFWPVRHLAELIRTKQVKAIELTEMYLERLHRYQPKLNFVVTFLDDLARAQAKAGRRRDRRRQVPRPVARDSLGRKDIISVKGYPTTWGAAALKASLRLRRQRRRAAARGRARCCWRRSRPASWRRAISGSAAAPTVRGTRAGIERIVGGLVVGDGGRLRRVRDRQRDERIDSQSRRTLRDSVVAADVRAHLALRRHGAVVDAGSLGPMVRYAEDAALVMQAIAKLDGRDMSVSDIPFNWDARIGHPQAARRLHQGVVRRADERRREGQRDEAARDAAIARRRQFHRDEDSGVADERQQPRRRVVRLLRRDAARGQAHGIAHGQREPADGAAPAGRRVPAAAAAADDDDDRARGSDEGRGRVSRRVERGWRRRRARPRRRSGRSAAAGGDPPVTAARGGIPLEPVGLAIPRVVRGAGRGAGGGAAVAVVAALRPIRRGGIRRWRISRAIRR